MEFRNFHRNIKIRIIESFLSGAASSMIFPFMALYLTSHFGIKLGGIMLLAEVLIGIVMNFLGGYVADQYGRKNIMLKAETIRFLAFVVMTLCNSPWFQSPIITFFMMTLNSISWGLTGPATQAMLIDVSTPDQRKLIYSITYWSSNLSIAIGGIIGAFLFKDYLFELFLVLSIIAGIIVILVAFFIEESHFPEKVTFKATHHIKNLIFSYKHVLQDRLFVLFTIAGVLLFSMELQLTNYISIRLNNEMNSQQFLFWEIDGVKMMGLLRSENTILVVLLMLLVTRITKQIKDNVILVLSCLLFSIGYSAISYSNNIWILLIMMVVLTVGEVFRIPVEQSYMASIPSDHLRSSYMALNGIKFNLAMVIASLTVTLSSFISSLYMTIFIFSIGLLGTVIYLFIIPDLEDRKSKGFNISDKKYIN
ncbi:MFS transporter [Bacillus sp. Leaf75]|nr:MFS transporter [Bacillus sp. Leaf75]